MTDGTEQLGELDALCRAMEGVAQLAGRGPCLEALDAECELWSHPKLPPGGMAADPQRSIEGLRRIIRAPEASPRAAAVASIALARLRRHLDDARV